MTTTQAHKQAHDAALQATQTTTMFRFRNHIAWAATMRPGGNQREVELQAAEATIPFLHGDEKTQARKLLRAAKA